MLLWMERGLNPGIKFLLTNIIIIKSQLAALMIKIEKVFCIIQRLTKHLHKLEQEVSNNLRRREKGLISNHI